MRRYLFLFVLLLVPSVSFGGSPFKPTPPKAEKKQINLKLPSPPPEVISTSPVNQQNNVPINTNVITVTFDKKMNSASINNENFKLQAFLKDKVLKVPIKIEYDYKNKSAIINPLTPNNNLSYNTDYSLMVSNNVQSENGIALGINYILKFKTQNSVLKLAKHISGGHFHSMFLKDDDGTVWITGIMHKDWNLGKNNTPTPFSKLPGSMKEISAGDIVSTALSINGEVIAWGPQSDEMPVVSPELKGSVQIIAGEEPDRISALKDGTVWLWSYFKEAPPTNIPDLQDINQISTAFHIITVLKKDGTVWIWHEYEGSFLNNQVPDLHGVVKIAAGDFFGLALKDDGTVWTWSHGDKSEPSYPIQVPNLEHIKDIAIGEAHCLALKSDGTVWTWGWNEMGQLGNGKNTQNQDIPVQVNNLHDVKEIAAGYAHSLAVTTDGEVWAWGWNKYGQLGDGTNGDKNTPTKINWSVIK